MKRVLSGRAWQGLAALLVLLPTLPGPAVLAQQTRQELSVGFLGRGEPESLDPSLIRAASPGDAAVIRQVFEPLLRFDEQLTPQPAAAESFDVSTDGNLVTFHLRKDGRWSDGQPVTAQQFEYSWKRVLDPGLEAEYAPFFVDAGIVGADDYNAGRAPTSDNVGVRASDDLTLEIRLNQPFGALPGLAALPVVSPLRPDLVAASPDWAKTPSTYIGNGPFALSDWVHADHLTLIQNPSYSAHAKWLRPTLTRISLPITTAPAADYAAFLRDDAAWTLVPASEVNRVLDDPSLSAQARQYNELTTFWVDVNTARPPLNDLNVRRALARALDRTAFVRDIAGGIGLPVTSVIPPGMPGFQDGLGQELGFDGEAARKLLGQAGLFDGEGVPSVTFSFADTPPNQRRAEYLQAEWKRHLGVDVQLSPIDPEGYQQALVDKNYDLAFGGWAADYPDPQNWFSAVFGCNGSYNSRNYCNPALDQLVARADAAPSLSDRVALYNQAQNRLIADIPVLPVFVLGHLALVKSWAQSTDGRSVPITALDDYPGSLFLDRVQILPH